MTTARHLPIGLYSTSRLQHLASIGGSIVIAAGRRLATFELASWPTGDLASVRLALGRTRKIPKSAVVAVVDPVVC